MSTAALCMSMLLPATSSMKLAAKGCKISHVVNNKFLAYDIVTLVKGMLVNSRIKKG